MVAGNVRPPYASFDQTSVTSAGISPLLALRQQSVLPLKNGTEGSMVPAGLGTAKITKHCGRVDAIGALSNIMWCNKSLAGMAVYHGD